MQDYRLDSILTWARDLYNFGARRPGSDEGSRAEEYLYGLMRGFGFQDVRLEPVDFHGWYHRHSSLVVTGKAGSMSFPAEPITYTSFTSGSGILAPIVDLENGTPEAFAKADLRGRIALVFYSHGYLEYEMLRTIGYHLHDPGESLKGKGQVMTWVTEEEQRVYQAAVEAGAVGFIGVFPLDVTPYLCYEGGNAFTGTTGLIPGIGIRKSDGKRLRSMLARGSIDGTLILTGEMRGARTRNVVALIPGKSRRVIQITSHHDSMWPGATEDASGVAVVLALARRAVREYADKQPEHTLAFVLEGAECLYVLGSRGHIGRHRDGFMKNLIADLHIEHLALECMEDESGALVPTGDIQPRAMFVTDAGPLIEIAREAVIKHNLRRTILLPTNTPLGVPTDASAYNRAGLPVVSFISPPVYWNALEDTWDKIAVDQILPTVLVYQEIIDRLLETDADSVRKPASPGDGYILDRRQVWNPDAEVMSGELHPDAGG